MDLRVRVGTVELANPVIGASGTCGTGVELAPVFDLAKLGGLVLKTVTRHAREGNPPCRVAETPSGMLNSIGLENPGIDRFCEKYLPAARELGVPLIASVAGRSPEDYAACARAIDKAGGAVAIEVNLSCPNDRSQGEGATPLAFGQDPRAAGEVVAAIREVTRLPLWAKLTSRVADIVSVARSCVDSGAEAIVAINTIPGMAIDIRTRRPVLHAVKGGLSGPAILPVALACVYDLARALDTPPASVVGCGGAGSAEDVVAFLLAGASAVEVGTATLRDPAAMVRIVEALPGLIEEIGEELGAGSAASLVGELAVGKAEEEEAS